MAMRSTLFALMQRKRSLLFLRQLWRRKKEKKAVKASATPALGVQAMRGLNPNSRSSRKTAEANIARSDT
jgi:hypothetical protein